MKQVFNIVRPREFEGRNGTQTAWDRVGVLIQDGDRFSLRLDSVPVGNWDGWLKAFPREERPDGGRARQAAPPAQHTPATAGASFDDDIPFAPLRGHC